MLCRIEDIPQLGSRVVKSADGDIAVFRIVSESAVSSGVRRIEALLSLIHISEPTN